MAQLTRDEIRQLVPALYWIAVQETKDTNSTRTHGRVTQKTSRTKAKLATEILSRLGFTPSEIEITLKEF